MQIKIVSEFQSDADIGAVKAIVNKCVHCGFCTATCPTYQILGDELDGPRGRIYLMKEMVEGAPVTTKTQTHLDRCLTCRNCESTCPSGVRNVDAATARVFDKLGVELVTASSAECCGAIRQHLSDHHGAEAQMKRNIDAWWPYVEKGIESIVINASGCGVMIKDYAEILANDPAYAEKARRISAMAKDVSEILPTFTGEIETLAHQKRAGGIPERVTYHPPCTLQHGQKIRGAVEALLGSLGVTVRLCQDSHLCCGSAGTYSILQAALSQELRDRKLANIAKTEPQEIVSGNVGCISHLQSGTDVPVRHWIELIDRMI